MNNRERVKAILNYQSYDRMPIVHFGYWEELLQKWVEEGHLTSEEIKDVADGNQKERAVSRKLGFDFNWMTVFTDNSDVLSSIYPLFERKVLEELSDGKIKVINVYGVIELEKPGSRSIPTEVDHLLKDRKSWEEHFKPRLQYSDDRINWDRLNKIKENDDERQEPLGAFCGSLFGQIRNMMGIQGISYLYADDEELYDEIINTIGELCYKTAEKILSSGIKFDFIHFWEDICFKNGPLVSPGLFNEKVGPHYKRITGLAKKHGINIASLDCDGKIDALIPTWIDNGVNTMFPIEVGTWNANIRPWREKYGKEIRGVGGMNKNIFAEDYAAVDKEIERLKPLVELGGYIPCPDHRIPPTAKWENVQYYCDRMRKVFG
ncbi:MAG: uroporphyrinogen decarboxylase family protein [Acetivibrionales bacterium]